MQSVLLVIFVLVAVALVISVLLQRSEGGALGMGGGGAGLGGLFSPRGAADTLTRTTAILAILFFASSLGLTLLALHSRPQSILDTGAGAPAQALPLQKPVPLPSKPQLPSVPTPHG
ncbi:MAG TPA: preprotein translocase subunit SecG [Rhizomicrobium sp.]